MIDTITLAKALSTSKVQYHIGVIERRVIITASNGGQVYARGNRNAKLYIAMDYVRLDTMAWDKTGVIVRLKRVAKLYKKDILVSDTGEVKIGKTVTRSKLVRTNARVYEEVTEFTTVATYDDITTALIALVK